MKNFLEKVPKQRQEACKKALHQIWEKENSYDQAKALLEEFVEEISSSLPKVAEWLSEEAEWTLTVYREAPSTHRKRLRTTNSVERLNQEMKRRGRAVRIFPNSESCIRLYSALLKEQHEDWITGRRYLKMEQLEQFQKRKALDSSENSPMNQEKETMAL